MNITEKPFKLTYLNAESEVEGENWWASGLHLMPVLRDLDKALHPNTQQEPWDVERTTLTEIGFMWERIVEREFKARMGERLGVRLNQVKLTQDGIRMSPDSVKVEAKTLVREFKATWRGAKKANDLEKHFWLWVAQIMGYCYGVGTTSAELYAFFVNGDYEMGKLGVPKVRMWEFEFSQIEIDQVWTMIKSHAEVMRKEGRA